MSILIDVWCLVMNWFIITGIILCIWPANEKWLNNVMLSLIGWAPAQNYPCITSTNGLLDAVPDHYPKQCWLLVNWIIWKNFQWNFNWITSFFFQENVFENVICKMLTIFFWPQCVNAPRKSTTCFCHIVNIASRQDILIQGTMATWVLIWYKDGILLI